MARADVAGCGASLQIGADVVAVDAVGGNGVWNKLADGVNGAIDGGLGKGTAASLAADATALTHGAEAIVKQRGSLDLDLDSMLDQGPMIVEWAERVQAVLPEQTGVAPMLQAASAPGPLFLSVLSCSASAASGSTSACALSVSISTALRDWTIF